MIYKRLDQGCESRILAYNADEQKVLIEARWAGNNRNIVEVKRNYFIDKYGVDPANENDTTK